MHIKNECERSSSIEWNFVNTDIGRRQRYLMQKIEWNSKTHADGHTQIILGYTLIREIVLVTLEKRRYDCTMINVRISAIKNATCHKEKNIILKHELFRMLISHLFQSRKMYAPWRNGRRLHLFIVVSNESNFIAVIYLFHAKIPNVLKLITCKK